MLINHVVLQFVSINPLLGLTPGPRMIENPVVNGLGLLYLLPISISHYISVLFNL